VQHLMQHERDECSLNLLIDNVDNH
jgi:hypothetical protein